jgi:Protein of unknown function (DUF3738).
MKLIGIALAITAGSCHAQTGTTARPEFEVASIKPSKPGTPGVSVHFDRGGLTASNASLQFLIHVAYQVENYQISGAPDWLNSQKFNIAARVPPNTPMDQLGDRLRPMLRTLLLDRFKLAVRRETKVLPGYALVVAKTVAKLRASTVEQGSEEKPLFTGRRGDLSAERVTITQLAETLSRTLGSPVLDMTGIKGVFELHLRWTPDENPLMKKPAESGEAPAEPADAPTIFTALQEQLGLKLEARKVPVEILVIDHVERTPSEN